MKHLIYLMLFSTAVFSQNYNYAVKNTQKSIIPAVVNNQLEEIEYFKAYLLPISQKANIQAALNKYGSIRLEKGDYKGVKIVMNTNQKLFGHPSLTQVSDITIAAGSTGVVLECLKLDYNRVTFEAGAPISNCTLKSLKHALLYATNAMLDDNVFLNIEARILFDCSVSGYIRNNKIIKHKCQTPDINLVMKGNSTTPSYGNVNLHSNYLTPGSDTTDISGLQTATFVGIDSEIWNNTGTGTKEMFYAQKIGNLKITDLTGGNYGVPRRNGAYNIDAKNLLMINKGIFSTDLSTVSSETNIFEVFTNEGSPRGLGSNLGSTISAHVNSNNIVLSSGSSGAIDAATVHRNHIFTNNNLTAEVWSRPTFETLPDPLGINWKMNRTNKQDQTAYIQNLINVNGVANLPEGIFYISSTLNIHLDGKHGITGSGTGKTVICGLTDDFPLLTLDSGQDNDFTLAHLTLQGGSVGLYAQRDSNGIGIGQIAYSYIKYVIFRNQNYGIQLRQITGLDNNFFENIGFINCNKGFFQDPRPVYNGLDTSSYVDKTMFYKCQFINNSISLSMLATRANNLNIWLDCKFDGGDLAFDLSANNATMIVNSDFTNFRGRNVISTNTASIYNCNFYNNSVTSSTVKAVGTFVEGCNFLDTTNLFEPMLYNASKHYVFNSTITGEALPSSPSTGGYGYIHGVYSNCILIKNPTASKLLVNVFQNKPQIIIDELPSPYPELLTKLRN